jgi:hypothetical protein
MTALWYYTDGMSVWAPKAGIAQRAQNQERVVRFEALDKSE